MIKLLRFLKKYKKETILAPLLKMTEAVFDLLVPLVVARIVDNGIAHSDGSYVLKAGAILVLLAVFGIVIAIIAQYYAAKAGAGFGTEVRNAAFKKVHSMSFADLDKTSPGSLITKLTTDINLVQAQVNMSIRLLLRSPFIVLGATVLAFFVNAKLAIIFIVTLVALFVAVVGITMIAVPIYRKVQSKLDRVMITTRENITGVRVIRAFNKQDDEVETYRKENAILNKFQVFAGCISALMNPVTFVVINLATVAILYFGGKRVYMGSVTQGQVVALVNYMTLILVELVKLANLIINLTRAFASAQRINEILDADTGMPNGNKNISTDKDVVVEFDHVSVTYDKAAEKALNDFSLKVKKGEVIGIIGETGSGKSTLINLIPRFYDATEGNVKVYDESIKDYDMYNLRDQIGVVPQKAILFDGTVKSNLAFAKDDLSESDMNDALKLSESYDFVMEKNGLDTEIRGDGLNLSGGQKQRLTIARALAKKPSIIILDDSSSALDYETDERVRNNLKSLENVTVFVVSQRTNAIADADRIVVLDDGNTAGIGTHEELLETCETYREIYKSQQEGAR